MDTTIPSGDDLKRSLSELTNGQLEALARFSGVPIHTLIKVRNGQTENPRLETVRAFVPHISKAKGLPTDGRERRDPISASQWVHPHRRETDKPNNGGGER
jgi:hypothetical protein